MRKKMLIVIADILAVIIAYGLALLLRFDMKYSEIPEQYIEGYMYYIVLASVLLVCCYVIAKLYRSVWSYAGINEILKTCVASIVACVLTGVVFSIAIMRMPISFYLIGWLLVFGFTASIRMMYRLLRRMRIKADNSKGNTERQNIMIIGAGAAGLVLLREYHNSYYLTDRVKIFIDDNAQK